MPPPDMRIEDGFQDVAPTFPEGNSPHPAVLTSYPLLLPTHTLLLAALNACLLLYLRVDHHRRSPWRNLPPGPAGLPLIGSLLELRGNPIQRLREIAIKYGPIFTIKFGLVRMIILSEVDIIQEALVTNGAIFNDRPAFLGVISGAGKTKGKYVGRCTIINTNSFPLQGMVALESGPFHRYQRLFTAEIMRAMGIGRMKGEKYFTKSVADLCRHLLVSDRRPLDAKTNVSRFVFSAFAVFLFGTDSDANQSLIKLRDSPAELFHQNPVFVMASKVFPRSLVEKLMPNKRQLFDGFLEMLQRRRRQFKENPRSTEAEWDSYLDGIVAIQHRYAEPNNSGDSSHDDGNHGDGDHANMMDKAAAALAPDDHYSLVFFDFFTVGTETSLIGLLWVLQMVMFHPRWQKRIQEELDEVVDADDAPSLSHKSRLHVTMATITEVYRFRPTSALGAPHRVTQDTFLRGYFIPEGSTVLTNIYAANNDSKLWKDPDTFDPGRFLDAEGKFKIPQRMMTFSAGQRSCPGMKWTHCMIFLFVTAILQKFTLKFPDGEKLPDMTGCPGINYSPFDFKICAIPR